MSLPEVVSAEQWQRERDALLVKEKALTRASDAVNAERRRLPMVAFEKTYVFDGPSGKRTLLELFEGRRQLIVYHFMMKAGSEHRCPGCSLLVDNIGPLAHLHARDVTLALTSPASLAQLEAFKKRMGWSIPWYSAQENDFTADCGVGTGFGISVFLRDGDAVYRTYFTSNRGGDQLVGTLRYLDLTPFGRQEEWEQPRGGGSDKPGSWWRLHDEYGR
jgi:predicted dithiol-disulfide oxidoreductase (DUF899 family)